METLENIGKKVFVLAAMKIIFRYSFVCLPCAVPVSMHYRLCLITVLTKVLQNGRRVRFSKRTDFWCAFSWSISNKNSQFFFWVSREQQFPRLWQHTQIMEIRHQLGGILVENQN